MDIEKFMKVAIEEAEMSVAEGNKPIGAVIVDLETKEILSKGHNMQVTEHDPTAHGEIVAIRKACKQKESTYLPNVALFTTTEPCTMCISAILKSKIPQLYFGISNKKLIDNGFRLIPFNNSKLVGNSSYTINIHGGVLEQECLEQRLRLK